MIKKKKDIIVGDELEKLKKYIQSDSPEKAKQLFLYPLFTKIFRDKFKIEGDAFGADGYVAGQLIIEGKTKYSQWLDGFYQALHYQKKFGLTYNTIMIVAHNFVGFWKVNKIPKEAFLLHHKSDVNIAPNKIGGINSEKTSKALRIEIRDSAIYWLEPDNLKGELFGDAKNLTTESFEIKKIISNLDSDRLQINPHNFINTIKRLEAFFESPIDAIHCFYTIVAYWDITSTATERPNGTVSVTGFKGKAASDDIVISPRKVKDFMGFIEEQYVFTNEGSGLTPDYYFSRFDEVLAEIQPEYVKQHGIFFTNDNLSKFALWFVKENFSSEVHENYIVFDPAAGSGNLISSWRQKLKHKIVSELQPDLLKTIESRMKIDPFHVHSGFTIVPKTVENKGLNFLDRSAADYLGELKKAVKESVNLNIDKPIAFLVNPPYKNTDENEKERSKVDANYEIHPSIIQLTGKDAGNERYLAFLGQILNISKEQATENGKLHPVVMIFTPTSWLIPRPTYIPFRKEWDKHFKFHSGFIVTSNEWFKLSGKWPLSFSIWTYDYNEDGNQNRIKLLDLTEMETRDLNISCGWNAPDDSIEKELKKVLKGKKKVFIDNSKGDIRDTLPSMKKVSLVKVENGWDEKVKLVQQTRYDFSTAKQEKDEGKLVSGFPFNDNHRHYTLKRKCGTPEGQFVGFMDDLTPVRVSQDSLKRMSINPDRVWFQLRPTFIDVNLTKAMNGTPDKYGYCAYDLPSAKSTFSWFAITKAMNGVYPVWANQYDIWPPKISDKLERYWYSLCFAFVLAENRCITTKFEKDNPVKGALEIFVENPLCPSNEESFWSTILDHEIIGRPAIAMELVDKVKQLYSHWNLKYCKGKFIYSLGLQNEPYFEHFGYKDFLTPHSGLIQIRKYAELEGKEDLLILFKDISVLTKKVKDEIYRLLVDEFQYF
jgi:hypothetical protein